jgi:hypothetical protein
MDSGRTNAGGNEGTKRVDTGCETKEKKTFGRRDIFETHIRTRGIEPRTASDFVHNLFIDSGGVPYTTSDLNERAAGGASAR